MSDLKAHKSLGQHWLHDDASLEAICDSAEVQEGDVVLEVGPGTGTLTAKILERKAQVIAVELDPRLADALRKDFFEEAFTLHMQSILKFDLTKLPKKYKLVANIPYYLTSHLIRIISESANPPSVAALLVQEEVARRVCAEPGKMSVLAITTQFYWEVELGLRVPAHLFTPIPKVDSQIVILKRRATAPFDVDAKQYFRLVKIGFSNKRKTLHNSLAAGLHIEKSVAKELLIKAHIPESARPQELSLNAWYDLFVAYNTKHKL